MRRPVDAQLGCELQERGIHEGNDRGVRSPTPGVHIDTGQGGPQIRGRKGVAMKFRFQKWGSRLLVMIAVPLLALGLRGIGWASVANPGPTNFVEIENTANVGFDSLPGAPFDWADSGANAPRDCTETPLMGGACTCNTAGVCSGTECKKECNGSGGLFDGGVFHSGTSNPTPPSIQTTDPSIVAAVFGVDELGISTNVAKVCTVSLAPCIGDSDCTAGTGDTCRMCGGGDP